MGIVQRGGTKTNVKCVGREGIDSRGEGAWALFIIAILFLTPAHPLLATLQFNHNSNAKESSGLEIITSSTSNTAIWIDSVFTARWLACDGHSTDGDCFVGKGWIGVEKE